jgi:hypothetical protein
MIFNPNNYSVIFLSYDEPNADENYQHLLSLKPDAMRVHGVKGSDNAHKECARLSKTKNVIIVDGDNYVNPDFFHNTIDLAHGIDLDTSVLSFSAYNTINGNQYGNGSIKVWPVNMIMNMQTHENSSDTKSIDFMCHDYLQLNSAGSEVRFNSQLQAFRAGLRDGVKLSLENNMSVNNMDQIDWRNYDRLWRWMHIGSDIQYGLWAIYGARLGCYMTLVEKWDYSQIRDFDFINNFFINCSNHINEGNILKESNKTGKLIRDFIKDERIKDVYSNVDSKTFRDTIKPILRSDENFIRYKYHPPYDVVFISYDEPNADKNFELLKEKAPHAKRIHGIKGIHQAHYEAAKICESDYFWVVDADAIILDNFVFEYKIEFYSPEKVRVWRSKNNVNDLIYGNGGVKLLPRMATLRMNMNSPDMTTSICKFYDPIMIVSNVTEFNSDSFHSWRSAFRECVKLSSQIINNQNSSESIDRLNIWCNVGKDKPYGKYILDGAKKGREYGTLHKGDNVALKKINDFNWLKEQYDGFYKNTLE